MKVFCAGHESDLLNLRALVLESAGCHVQIGDPAAAIEASSATTFDVLVLDSGISPEEEALMCGALQPSVRLVRLGQLTLPADLISAVMEKA